MEYPPSPPQSALMPVNLTTLPHFSVSSAISSPKSAGESASGALPRSTSRALIWIGKGRVDLLVELVNNLSRRAIVRTDAVPSARLVTRHELCQGGDVRQRLGARRGRHRQGAEFACPDVFDCLLRGTQPAPVRRADRQAPR